ncbi:E3 ubiquitin ligase BIG BROTHER-related -like protein [Gossypium arboreum]|uniref:RING-type E3 ubiquitin transferase n=1 Tax=Gossypium arboreum TaxID=29729 RepID=A0A0B0MFN3_GOSAR|nr:E3 ubiquitin ligase BIG BROTHER-related -like protein [Gossypium arboreum]
MSSLMQGQGSTIDSFPEIVNIDEGTSPNNTSIGQPNSLHDMLNPVETRLSNFAAPSGGTMHRNAITLDVQSISGWNSGQPSSRQGVQNQVTQDALNHRLNDDGEDARIRATPRSEERRIEPLNVFFTGRLNNGWSGNLVRSGPICLQSSSSNHIPENVNLNEGFISGNGTRESVVGTGGRPNLHDSGGLEREQISNASVSSDNVGSSSGSSNHVGEENNDGSGSSLGSYGLSCKRKALEGTSGQSFSAGASGCFQQVENIAWHASPTRNEASSSLSLSTPSSNFLNVTPPDQSNPRVGLGMRGVVSDAFLSLGERRANPGNEQESLPFSLLSTRAAGHSSFVSPSHPRVAPVDESLNMRPTTTIAGNSGSTSTQPHMRTASIVPRNVHPISRNGTSSSSVCNPSSSSSSGEIRGEPNIRNISRNNVEHPMFVPATEMRNVAQDPTGWSLASGNPSTSGSLNPSSNIHPLPDPAWIPPHNPPIHNQQRLSEFASWSLFPPIGSGFGGHSGRFPLPSSRPSASSQETVGPSESNSQGNNQPCPRLALILERHDDDVLGMAHSLRALAADIEGRHRLISEIRQVLNAVHRGENLQIEELLALEERIGDVSTGLSEEMILKLMEQRKHSSTSTESQQDLEPCCICQEEYANGDDTGILDCGHDFHSNCIKQWLMLKNLCPICKTTGLLK